MGVSIEDVKYVAALARLKFSEGECKEFEEDLNNILLNFEKLNELDTTGVVPTAHVVHLKNRLREDVVKESIDRDAALENAPSVMDGFFKVPKIIE